MAGGDGGRRWLLLPPIRWRTTMADDDGGRRWLVMALADDQSRWLATVTATVEAEAKI